MTDLSALLTQHIGRFDALLAHPDTEAADVMGEQKAASLLCTFEATLSEPDTGGPRVEARAHIAPGGYAEEAEIVVWEGEEVARMDVEPDSGLHRALELWFGDMWVTWDDVQEEPGEHVVVTSALGLIPGDHVYRLGLTVADVEDAGVDSSLEPMVTVRYRETHGTDVWRADRGVTVIREAPEGGDH